MQNPFPYIEAVENRVVIEVEAPIKKTAGGIIMPDDVRDDLKVKSIRGRIVAIGPGKWNEEGTARMPMVSKPGDCVLFSIYHGNDTTIDGRKIKILPETELLCRLVGARWFDEERRLMLPFEDVTEEVNREVTRLVSSGVVLEAERVMAERSGNDPLTLTGTFASAATNADDFWAVMEKRQSLIRDAARQIAKESIESTGYVFRAAEAALKLDEVIAVYEDHKVPELWLSLKCSVVSKPKQIEEAA